MDSSGNAYVTGYTLPLISPQRMPSSQHWRQADDAFVTKLNAAGSALVYSTYLGGSGL